MKHLETEIICPICKRNVPKQFEHKHHLIPKSRKGKETILLCIDCGKILHKLFTNKELEREYNNLEAILSHPKIRKWIEWISKKTNNFGFCMATKKRKKY